MTYFTIGWRVELPSKTAIRLCSRKFEATFFVWYYRVFYGLRASAVECFVHEDRITNF